MRQLKLGQELNIWTLHEDYRRQHIVDSDTEVHNSNPALKCHVLTKSSDVWSLNFLLSSNLPLSMTVAGLGTGS